MRGFVDAQAVATIGLLPVAVVLFGQASAAGPLANLVAIPWWSLVVVPLSLLGTALEALHAGAGTWPWRLAAGAFDLSWPLFQRAYESGEMSQNAGGRIRWARVRGGRPRCR